jgi:hypothetical protein
MASGRPLRSRIPDLVDLAVGQRVHRINYYGFGPWRIARKARAYGAINDRHEEAKGLSRTGPRTDDEALSGGGL